MTMTSTRIALWASISPPTPSSRTSSTTPPPPLRKTDPREIIIPSSSLLSSVFFFSCCPKSYFYHRLSEGSNDAPKVTTRKCPRHPKDQTKGDSTYIHIPFRYALQQQKQQKQQKQREHDISRFFIIFGVVDANVFLVWVTRQPTPRRCGRVRRRRLVWRAGRRRRQQISRYRRACLWFSGRRSRRLNLLW